MMNIEQFEHPNTGQCSRQNALNESREEEEIIIFDAAQSGVSSISSSRNDTPFQEEIDNGVRPPDPGSRIRKIRSSGLTTPSFDRIISIPRIAPQRVRSVPPRLGCTLRLSSNDTLGMSPGRRSGGISADDCGPVKKPAGAEVGDASSIKYNLGSQDHHLDRHEQTDREDHISPTRYKMRPQAASFPPKLAAERHKGKESAVKDDSGAFDDTNGMPPRRRSGGISADDCGPVKKKPVADVGDFSPIKYNLRSQDLHLERQVQADRGDHISPTRYKVRPHPMSPALPAALDKREEQAVSVKSGEIFDGPFKRPLPPTRKRRLTFSEPAAPAVRPKKRKKTKISADRHHNDAAPLSVQDLAESHRNNAKSSQNKEKNSWYNRLDPRPPPPSSHVMVHRSTTRTLKDMFPNARDVFAPIVVHRPHQKEMRRIRRQLAMAPKLPPPKGTVKKDEKEARKKGEEASAPPAKRRRRSYFPMPVLEPQCSPPLKNFRPSEVSTPPTVPTANAEETIGDKRGGKRLNRDKKETPKDYQMSENAEEAQLEKQYGVFKVPEISQERLEELFHEFGNFPKCTEEERFEWFKGAIMADMNFAQIEPYDRFYLNFYQILKNAELDFTREFWVKMGKEIPPDQKADTLPTSDEVQPVEPATAGSLNGNDDSEENVVNPVATEMPQEEVGNEVSMDTWQPVEGVESGATEGGGEENVALSLDQLRDVMKSSLAWNNDTASMDSNASVVSEDSARCDLSGILKECGMDEDIWDQELGDQFPDLGLSPFSSTADEAKPSPDENNTVDFPDGSFNLSDFFSGGYEDTDRVIDGYVQQQAAVTQQPVQRISGKPTLRNYLIPELAQPAPHQNNAFFSSYGTARQFYGASLPDPAAEYHVHTVAAFSAEPLPSTPQISEEFRQTSPFCHVAVETVSEMTQTDAVEEFLEAPALQPEAVVTNVSPRPAPEESYITASGPVTATNATTSSFDAPIETPIPVAQESVTDLHLSNETAAQMTAAVGPIVKGNTPSEEKSSQMSGNKEGNETDGLIQEASMLLGVDFSGGAGENDAYRVIEFYRRKVLKMVERTNKEMEKMAKEERKFFELARCIRNERNNHM